jgi:outer membrane protein assembly factor BamB
MILRALHSAWTWRVKARLRPTLANSPILPQLIACLLCFALAGQGISGQVVAQAVDIAGTQQDQVRTAYIFPIIGEADRQAYEDFQKLIKEKDWSRAFRSIQDQMRTPPDGLMPAVAGRPSLTWREQIWRDFQGLPAEARSAYRIFHDPATAKALKQIEALPEVERWPALENLYWTSFLSSDGDLVAYRLAIRECGRARYRRAAAYLQDLIDGHPDTDLNRAEVWTLLCLCLVWSEQQQHAAEAIAFTTERFGDQSVRIKISGDLIHEGTVTEILERARETRGGGEVSRADVPKDFEFPEDGPSFAWKRSLSVEEATTPDKAKPAPRENVLKGLFNRKKEADAAAPNAKAIDKMVPALAVWGDRVAVDRGTEVKVLSLLDGSLIWKSKPRGIMPEDEGSRPVSVLHVAGGSLFTTRIGKRRVSILECRDAAATEDHVIWSTEEPEFAKGRSVLCPPVVMDGFVFLLMGDNSIRQFALVVLQQDTGSLVREVALGTPATASQDYWGWSGNQGDLFKNYTPRLTGLGEQVIVMTDGGALCAVSSRGGSLQWALPYDFRSSRIQPGGSPASVVADGGLLYFRSQGSRRLIAFHPVDRQVIWERAVPADSRLLGMDADGYYLLGAELMAIDRKTRELLWSRRLTHAARNGGVIVTESQVLVPTSGQIQGIDKKSGDTISRTPLPGFEKNGTVLHLTPQGHLLIVDHETLALVRSDS